MFTTTNINESINIMREIAKANNLGDAISAKINELADWCDGHSNVYDYAITVKAVNIMNTLIDVCYDYTVEHYGKEIADKWITKDHFYVDPDEEYGYLMRDVCF